MLGESDIWSKSTFSQRSHESCILLQRNIQNEQNIFLKFNIFLKLGIFLLTTPCQNAETWNNLTKDHKTL